MEYGKMNMEYGKMKYVPWIYSSITSFRTAARLFLT
jgi:hypothetical protein